ncbi:ATP-binding cassette domain-containing protein [Arthrobacter sp. JZ12]|uniref:ABC transporter ATP-binding protein n=1 Tax=Arthrobacter sp. JZ12 TaxID=2654190 RepID=UPI002B4A7705|nr:ABC transporter ATP-binding protein [Arthrobacter sp. JZ12]WRH25223.1 ATP-binding cassette domain-containing protein [Arthrobacter sp. JZ12]
MTAVIDIANVSKTYGRSEALRGVTLALEPDRIYGLLGRNGAGKTTLMSILTAQAFASAGEVRVFGEHPYENERVLNRICFIRESQKYPDSFTAEHAFRSAALFFANWSQELADKLTADFQLPLKRNIKKLSRGQLSAVGVIIGLASRAELTFFDEPYLGLDAVARQLFYDRLVEDYSLHPRTIVLSSHLIDEVANLLEHVIVIDRGRIIMNDDAESIRGSAFAVVGSAEKVRSFIGDREVVHTDNFASLASVTALGQLTDAEVRAAADDGLELAPVSLQQLIVRKTMSASQAADARDRNLSEAAR